MSIRPVQTSAAPQAVGPYSQAITIDGMVFTSGQIPIDPATNQFRGDLDVAGQTRLVLANLAAVLQAAGSAPNQVVKATVFVASMADFPIVNAEYAAFFGEHRPARSTVEVAALPLGAKVEIELVALR